MNNKTRKLYGIDIYEGDIVFYSYLDGYCNMQKTKSIVRVECQDFVVSLLKDYNPSISNISDIEVIGNICDNKELINK